MGKWRGQSNKVCFTLNNYTNDELQELSDFFDKWYEEETLAYGIIGEESGSSGTLHLQGYVRLNSKAKRARQVSWTIMANKH